MVCKINKSLILEDSEIYRTFNILDPEDAKAYAEFKANEISRNIAKSIQNSEHNHTIRNSLISLGVGAAVGTGIGLGSAAYNRYKQSQLTKGVK